jgi:hypothetical protein
VPGVSNGCATRCAAGATRWPGPEHRCRRC